MDFQATKVELSLLSAIYSSYPNQILYNPVPASAARLISSGLVASAAPLKSAFDLSCSGRYLSLTDSGVSFYLNYIRSRRSRIAEWIRYIITTAIAVAAFVLSIVALVLQQRG